MKGIANSRQTGYKRSTHRIGDIGPGNQKHPRGAVDKHC